MNTLTKTLAAIAFILPVCSTYAANSITSLTGNDPVDGNVTYPTTPSTTLKFTTTLVDFTASGTTYSNLVFADTVSSDYTATEWRWGNNSPDNPGSTISALTDDRIDTLVLNLEQGTQFEFASAPTSLSDILFIFDVATPETSTRIQLIDSANNTFGNEVALTEMSGVGFNIDFQRSIGGFNNYPVNGIAIPFSDFGITAGQLSNVDGYVFSTNGGVDMLVTGFAATIPEPSSTTLIALACSTLMLRRKR